MGIVVIGDVFIDVKGYSTAPFIPGGRNAGVIQQIHGGVGRNVVEDIANVELEPTFVGLVDNDAMGEDVIQKLFENGQVATQYVDEAGNPTMDEEWNVNGSYAAIEGITSPDGRCFGKMAHIERKGEAVAMNIYGEQDLKVFESGVKYFK